jgi:flavin reductase (DIM6/NTAB) family NADH-FMN oxidoreductase RutF
MEIDPLETSVKEIYQTMTQAIAPRPIAWVSTVSPSGVTNLAPYSYFNGVCSKPAVLSFSAVNKPDGSAKDTVRNIRANEQFVVNVVPFELARAMVDTSAEIPYGESEIDSLGLKTKESVRVAPPRIVGTPFQLECSLFQIVEVGEGATAASLVLGKIELIHVDESMLDADGKIDANVVDAVGRLGGREYCRTQDRFSLP